MRRRRTPMQGNHSLEMEIEPLLNVEVRGYCSPGEERITNAPIERCQEGCPAMAEDLEVILTVKDKRIDITDWLPQDTIDDLTEDLLTDYFDCNYDDNDAAYEASVGK